MGNLGPESVKGYERKEVKNKMVTADELIKKTLINDAEREKFIAKINQKTSDASKKLSDEFRFTTVDVLKNNNDKSFLSNVEKFVSSEGDDVLVEKNGVVGLDKLLAKVEAANSNNESKDYIVGENDKDDDFDDGIVNKLDAIKTAKRGETIDLGEMKFSKESSKDDSKKSKNLGFDLKSIKNKSLGGDKSVSLEEMLSELDTNT